MHDNIEQDDAIPLPAPVTVAERCMSCAWDDDTPDRERLLLEQASLTITRLAGRCADLAGVIEREELRRASR